MKSNLARKNTQSKYFKKWNIQLYKLRLSEGYYVITAGTVAGALAAFQLQTAEGHEDARLKPVFFFLMQDQTIS